jgi:hypothetical protein
MPPLVSHAWAFFRLGMYTTSPPAGTIWCFLLGLIAAQQSLRRMAWVVTAFTLAHSLTLSLAARRPGDAAGRLGGAGHRADHRLRGPGQPGGQPPARGGRRLRLRPDPRPRLRRRPGGTVCKARRSDKEAELAASTWPPSTWASRPSSSALILLLLPTHPCRPAPGLVRPSAAGHLPGGARLRPGLAGCPRMKTCTTPDTMARIQRATTKNHHQGVPHA